MKIATLILLATSTAFAATSVYLTQRARVDRGQSSKVEAERNQLVTRVKQLEQERNALQTEVRSLRGGDVPRSASIITGSFGSPPTTAPTSSRAVPKGTGAGFSVFGMNQGVVRSWAGPSDPPPPMPPAMRKMMQKQMRQQFERMYEDVGADLGLTAEETSKLLDTLAASNTFEPFYGMQDQQAMQKKMEERRRREQADLQALLGPEKMAKLADYQKTLASRQELGQFQEQLAAEDVPMQPEQRKQLLSSIIEDQQQNPHPSFAPGIAPEDLSAQMEEWQKGREQRLLDAARGVLTAKQLAVFRAYQDYQQAMRQRFATAVPITGAQGEAVFVDKSVTTLSAAGGTTATPAK
jgi:hypothetical protein